MEREEYAFVLGLLLILAALAYPPQHLMGTFCEGESGRLGDYTVSVSNGFLRVVSGEELFVARKSEVLLEKVPLDYNHSDGCYTLQVTRKPETALYLFALGAVMVGGFFYYVAFLKYR
ncbi:hypothetical protein [Palaeococcus ferrophilus]|uniref:hypothetical protein n=1 Tax=Palaeococcus ferrophilus TaxID=83868 RepID=UPI00064F9604|nr:hypothetical protein [Palaeococcus ferrophilus]